MLGRQRMPRVRRPAVASRLDEQLVLVLPELEDDVLHRNGRGRPGPLSPPRLPASAPRSPRAARGRQGTQPPWLPARARRRGNSPQKGRTSRRTSADAACAAGSDIPGFYSEMRPNRRRALRQSASICARSASTSGNCRSSLQALDEREPERTGRRGPDRGRRRALRSSGDRRPRRSAGGRCSSPTGTRCRRSRRWWRTPRRGRAGRSRSRGWPSGTRCRVPGRRRGRHRAVDEVVVPEQAARLVDAALGDEPPDAGAADHEILVADRVDLLGSEPVTRAEAAQHRERAGTFVAEQEVGADPDLRHVQPFDEHGPHERLRLPERQLAA